MDKNCQILPLNAQKKYRRSQTNKGLVRFELQVKAESKARFDAIVEAIAQEYQGPWDKRQRIAKARAQAFDKITQGILHEFSTLNDEIAQLKAEIQALSPTFFINQETQQTPLPEAIRSLPDDPQQLKKLLAKIYHEMQQTKQAAHEYKRRSEQYLHLYEAVDNCNDELRNQLKAAEISSRE